MAPGVELDAETVPNELLDTCGIQAWVERPRAGELTETGGDRSRSSAGRFSTAKVRSAVGLSRPAQGQSSASRRRISSQADSPRLRIICMSCHQKLEGPFSVLPVRKKVA